MARKYFVAPDVVVLLPRFTDTPRLMQPRKAAAARHGWGILGWLLRLTSKAAAPPARRSTARGYRERHDPASGR